MSTFESKIGYEFKNKNLLEQSLTHSSYAYEKNLQFNYERLEFLGDAILEMVISKFLFNKFPKMSEGELTKLRAASVCEPSLAKIAKQIELGKYLKFGRGEDLTGGRQRESILADVLEAIFGAVYLDSDFDHAEKIILGLMKSQIEKISSDYSFGDYKTHLQEIIQKTSKIPLIYKVVGEKGPDHNKTFIVELSHEGKTLAKAEGKNKKEAEQNAACEAINFLLKEKK